MAETAMEELCVNVEDPRWEALDFEALARSAFAATLAELAQDATLCEVSVLGCDDTRIAVLNGDFRDKPRATNVLSWPAEERGADMAGGNPQPVSAGLDGLVELGDIAISYDTCAAEAEAGGIAMRAHVTHLLVHGLLHLMGYDHENDPDAALMEGLEVKILGKMGLHDPYRN